MGDLLYLCWNDHPDSLLSEAHCPEIGTLVVVAAVSDAERWLSVLPVVKTAAVTRRPAAAEGSAGRPDRGLRNRKCN